jgi:alpha-mannosidase
MPPFSFNEPGILKFDKNFVIKEPTLLFQAFNNSWGTNFPQWIGGNLCFRYRIAMHENTWREYGSWVVSDMTINRPISTYVNKRSSMLKAPVMFDLLYSDLEDFTVLTFKLAEDGSGCILRIIEASGTSRKTRLRFNPIIKEVYICDLLERRKEQTDIQLCTESMDILLSTRAFEIHTLYLKL